MVSLLREKGSEDEEIFDAFNRRIHGKAEGDGEELSPVLYREKLAKEFNSRGFMKFRNLAKISRSKRRRRRKGNEKRGRKIKGQGGMNFLWWRLWKRRKERIERACWGMNSRGGGTG